MCGTAAIPSAKMERRFRKTTKFKQKKTGKNGQTLHFGQISPTTKSKAQESLQQRRILLSFQTFFLASRPLFSIYIMVRLYRKGLEHNNVTRFRYNSRYFTANATAHCRIDGAKKPNNGFFRSLKIPFYCVVHRA